MIKACEAWNFSCRKMQSELSEVKKIKREIDISCCDVISSSRYCRLNMVVYHLWCSIRMKCMNNKSRKNIRFEATNNKYIEKSRRFYIYNNNLRKWCICEDHIGSERVRETQVKQNTSKEMNCWDDEDEQTMKI